jgi:threonine synthase
MGRLLGLICRDCGKLAPAESSSYCEECFAPLEPAYDYEAIRPTVSREIWAARPANIWRYSELLPLLGPPAAALPVGFTPLLPARKLGRALGHNALFIKNDAINFPTLSFKDRVVAVALNKAIELGYDTIACSSTGNLANALAAQAAFAGLKAVVFVPADLEEAKLVNTRIYGATLVRVEGNYDAVNRLCTQISQEQHWAFVNVNLRPYYAEGSKTVGYEIAEQLGWRLPEAVVVPMAGGSLIGRVYKAFGELGKLGLVEPRGVKIFGAQASGCAPIVRAVQEGREQIQPERPATLARSLAIGNPADGLFAARVIRDSGGWGAHVSDDEMVEGIRLLASCEGVFTETAGGVTVASFRRLLAEGRIGPDETTVLCITGNGLKTTDAVCGVGGQEFTIAPKLAEFKRVVLGAAPPQLSPRFQVPSSQLNLEPRTWNLELSRED